MITNNFLHFHINNLTEKETLIVNLVTFYRVKIKHTKAPSISWNTYSEIVTDYEKWVSFIWCYFSSLENREVTKLGYWATREPLTNLSRDLIHSRPSKWTKNTSWNWFYFEFWVPFLEFQRYVCNVCRYHNIFVKPNSEQ